MEKDLFFQVQEVVSGKWPRLDYHGKNHIGPVLRIAGGYLGMFLL
jgi:hypothetical protein